MVKLGWLARKMLIQTWEAERHLKNVFLKPEALEKLKQTLGDIDPHSFPISIGSIREAIVFEIINYVGFANLGDTPQKALKVVHEKSFHNALKTLLKRGLLMWSEPKPDIGGVKLTERGRRVAQQLWLESEEKNLLKQAIIELKGKGYQFATTEQLLNQIWEVAKAHDVDEKIFRKYWSERRVGLLLKELGVRRKLLWVHQLPTHQFIC